VPHQLSKQRPRSSALDGPEWRIATFALVASVLAAPLAAQLGKSFGRLDGLVGAIRAHGTFESIRGPITCDDVPMADPTSECFQGTRSDDKYSPNIFGADFSLGWTMAGGRLRPYLGGGYNRLEPRFQVNFTNQLGVVDSTRIEVNLNRGVVFGGATGQLTDRLGVAAEIYAVPADAVTARLVVRTAIGPN
jgi:hypothetical protein